MQSSAELADIQHQWINFAIEIREIIWLIFKIVLAGMIIFDESVREQRQILTQFSAAAVPKTQKNALLKVTSV